MIQMSKRYGLEKHTYVRSTQWTNDFDYLDKLSATELNWLNEYADAEMKGSFSKTSAYSSEEKRAIWSDLYRRKTDLYSISQVSNRMVQTDECLSIYERSNHQPELYFAEQYAALRIDNEGQEK